MMAWRTLRPSRILAVACLCTLGALGLMTWQLFEPGPVQVLVALSLGQVLGTGSLLALGFVVFRDLRTARKAARQAVERIDD
jgi:hypothetical protein